MTDVEQRFPEVYKIGQKFKITNEQLKEVMTRMQSEIELGLGKSTQQRASIKCWPTYVHDLPSGDEKGNFMSVSMGHRNLSVHLLTLERGCVKSIVAKTYDYRFHKQMSTGQLLFDYVARCLADFVKFHQPTKETLPLGFTVCFPCRQQCLSKASLVMWPMDFSCEGVIGKDVGKMLQEAIERRNDVFLKVIAILNDTTGTFMACGYRNRACRIGVIIGGGTNACYLEYLKRISTIRVDDPTKLRMLINTEWGMFGENGVLDFLRTDYDKTVDRQSTIPGRQIYEKLIAGPYLGEVVRLVILELMASQVLFKDNKPDKLSKRDAFQTSFIAMFTSVDPGCASQTRDTLQNLGLLNVTDDDLSILRYICETISGRSAQLVSAGLACLLNHLKEPHMAIGIDGFIYNSIPRYHDNMLSTMRTLVKPGITYELVPTKNGDGEGGALTAAANAFYM